VLPDRAVHRIRRQVQIAGPGDPAQFDPRLAEKAFVSQRGNDSGVGELTNPAISTVPSVPSLNRTSIRKPGSACMPAIRQGALEQIANIATEMAVLSSLLYVDICQRAPYIEENALSRPRHPSKEIEAAVAFAEARGWGRRKAHGHAWARLLCPRHDREGCQLSVWSTPKNPENHAKALVRAVNSCPHAYAGDDDEDA
jgi:hypothetical protein